jgi:hypothetical protein
VGVSVEKKKFSHTQAGVDGERERERRERDREREKENEKKRKRKRTSTKEGDVWTDRQRMDLLRSIFPLQLSREWFRPFLFSS